MDFTPPLSTRRLLSRPFEPGGMWGPAGTPEANVRKRLSECANQTRMKCFEAELSIMNANSSKVSKYLAEILVRDDAKRRAAVPVSEAMARILFSIHSDHYSGGATKNSSSTSSGWDDSTLALVWAKGRVVADFDPIVWRGDVYGNLIRRSDHGDRQSQYGWEVDHIVEKSLGGSDQLHNLRPLHWKMNASRGGQLGNRMRRP